MSVSQLAAESDWQTPPRNGKRVHPCAKHQREVPLPLLGIAEIEEWSGRGISSQVDRVTVVDDDYNLYHAWRVHKFMRESFLEAESAKPSIAPRRQISSLRFKNSRPLLDRLKALHCLTFVIAPSRSLTPSRQWTIWV
jgi:hypothetical protein